MEIMLEKCHLAQENMSYIVEQEGFYQNKVNSSLISTCNCKMG